MVLIDGGATHNFIDRTLVERRGLPMEEFEGFTVVVVGGDRMECTRWIPKNITLGYYSLTDDLFVVDVPDTNVVRSLYYSSTPILLLLFPYIRIVILGMSAGVL